MKYAIYVRVSSKQQGATGLSLKAQLRDCVSYLKSKGITEFTVYKEVASAKHYNKHIRPQLHAAIEYCVEHSATLLVAKLDRLSRNQVDTLTIFNKLDNRLHALNLGEETSTLSLGVYSAISQYEREACAARTATSLAVKLEDYKAVHGRDWRASNKISSKARKASIKVRQAIAKENRETVIHLITNNRSLGQSYNEIAQLLNIMQHKAPKGGAYHAATVRRMYVEHCKSLEKSRKAEATKIKDVRQLGQQAIKEGTNKMFIEVYPVIQQLRDENAAISLRAIAKYLNENNYKTSKGRAFHATTIKTILKHAELSAKH